ncbi:hypothetical protein AWC25_01010 [Mycobacterium sherrisii]|nr:hypothetical protein AWC25_01010 [Mycobacterium sherrisii]
MKGSRLLFDILSGQPRSLRHMIAQTGEIELLQIAFVDDGFDDTMSSINRYLDSSVRRARFCGQA